MQVTIIRKGGRTFSELPVYTLFMLEHGQTLLQKVSETEFIIHSTGGVSYQPTVWAYHHAARHVLVAKQLTVEV